MPALPIRTHSITSSSNSQTDPGKCVAKYEIGLLYPRRGGVDVAKERIPNPDRQAAFTVGRRLSSKIPISTSKVSTRSWSQSFHQILHTKHKPSTVHASQRKPTTLEQQSNVQIEVIVMHYPYHSSRARAYFRPARLLFEAGTLPPMANGSDNKGRVSFLEDSSGC